MTAENSFMYVLPLMVVGAICLIYTRVLIARWVMQDVNRVDFSDPWQKWAVKVLFPKRPSGSEPRIISPGTHLALYRVKGIYYYRELERIYPMWKGKRTFTMPVDTPIVWDWSPTNLEDYCEEDLTVLTAGQKTRITITDESVVLSVNGVEEIRILR